MRRSAAQAQCRPSVESAIHRQARRVINSTAALVANMTEASTGRSTVMGTAAASGIPAPASIIRVIEMRNDLVTPARYHQARGRSRLRRQRLGTEAGDGEDGDAVGAVVGVARRGDDGEFDGGADADCVDLVAQVAQANGRPPRPRRFRPASPQRSATCRPAWELVGQQFVTPLAYRLGRQNSQQDEMLSNRSLVGGDARNSRPSTLRLRLRSGALCMRSSWSSSSPIPYRMPSLFGYY